MRRILLLDSETIHQHLYRDHECVDMFGQDMLDDFGVNMPSELVERILACQKEFEAVQDLIEAFKKVSK